MEDNNLFSERTIKTVGRFIACVVLGLGIGTLFLLFALLVKVVF